MRNNSYIQPVPRRGFGASAPKQDQQVKDVGWKVKSHLAGNERTGSVFWVQQSGENTGLASSWECKSVMHIQRVACKGRWGQNQRSASSGATDPCDQFCVPLQGHSFGVMVSWVPLDKGEKLVGGLQNLSLSQQVLVHSGMLVMCHCSLRM